MYDTMKMLEKGLVMAETTTTVTRTVAEALGKVCRSINQTSW